MPLTEKGSEIKSNMEKEYGPEKGEKVFYASKNAGTISGVDSVPLGHGYDGPSTVPPGPHVRPEYEQTKSPPKNATEAENAAAWKEMIARKTAEHTARTQRKDAPPPPSGPPEDPAVMPPQNLTQPMGMTEPTDCSVGEMFGKQHDFSADAASPMGGLPQSVGFGDMLKWKPF